MEIANGIHISLENSQGFCCYCLCLNCYKEGIVKDT